MFRSFTHTTFAAAVLALVPAIASAQNFYSPYGGYYAARGPVGCQAGSCVRGSCNPCGTCCVGGCYGGSRSGCNNPYCQGSAGGAPCNCPSCQGQCGGQACAAHGIVNCPQCQGLNSHVPLQMNFNGYSGSQYQPVQYPQSRTPYFDGSTYRTRGTYEPAPTSPGWYGPTTSTYSQQTVTLY